MSFTAHLYRLYRAVQSVLDDPDPVVAVMAVTIVNLSQCSVSLCTWSLGIAS